MGTWRQLAAGLRVLFRPGAADRDLDDEVAHYLEQETAHRIANGASPDDAQRDVRLAFGSAIGLREGVRAGAWEHTAGTILADLRYAARGLRAHPGFTAAAAVTLALGIGATTVIVSAVKPVLFDALPYPHADRVTAIWDRGTDSRPIDITFGTYRELVERTRAFDAIAAMKPWQPALTGTAEPERLEGQRVSAPYFQALGVAPMLGRNFAASEDLPPAPGGRGVVIVADGLWRRRFAADPSIVGRDITLNDVPFTVVGVMPPSFENIPLPAAEIWTTLQYDPSLPQSGREWGHHLQAIARLRPGVRVQTAAAELDGIAQHPIADRPRAPWAAMTQGLILQSLQDDVTAGVRPALIAVLGAVIIVLAIACVNVTNLLLARGARRRDEIGLRAALGASRGRLIRQMLTESLLLSAIGGALGIAVARAGLGALVAVSPLRLPRIGAIHIDAAVLVVAFTITSIVGLVVGLIPALDASRRDLRGVPSASRVTGGGQRRTRGALVVAEVALAIVLLVSAGLLVRSLQRLFAIDPGFDPAGLLTMQVQISARQFNSAPATHAFFDRALEAVSRLPGVTGAGFTTQLPLSGDLEKYGTKFESSPTEDALDDHSALRYAVSAGYIETMGIPLRRGRVFTDRDGAGAPPVALVNESFAKRRFPNQDAVGQRLHLGRTDAPWITIVGVVADVKQTSLALPQSDAVYIPAPQWPSPDRVRSLVVRARGDSTSLAARVRDAIWTVDKDQPIVRVATMDGLLAATAAERRFALLLFEAFAIAALALAAVGIYGVLAGSVAERVREIGVRSALGASSRDIVSLIMRHGIGLTVVGIAIGVAGAAAASRALATLLFGISPLDPATYLGVVLLLSAVSALACGLPAWRATRIDPSVTLRAE